MVIWVDTNFKIVRKMWHIKKKFGRLRRAFCSDYGDIPTGSFNEKTGQFEECVNPRGYAYALRNSEKYKKNKKKHST